jgi:predicted secreted protein
MRLVGRAASSLALTLFVVAVLAATPIALSVRLFGFGPGGAMALYFVVWWTVLFAVLPFGVRSQAESGEVAEGSDPGAPAAPALREKAIWTTVVSAVPFLAIAWLLPLLDL